MKQIQLTPTGASSQQAIARGGAMLHIINNPLLTLQRAGEAGTSYRDRLTGAKILVGFDRAPSIDSFDAVVPPFYDACFAVPDRVAAVILSVPYLDFSASPTSPIQLLVEWLASAQPFMSPITPPILVSGQGVFPSDLNQHYWPQIPATPVFDQQYRGQLVPFMRPVIAPSVVDTIHQVTAAATLFNFNGPNGILSNAAIADMRNTLFYVVHRIIVSVSVACLFVVGGPDLTVGSPGTDEIGRIAFEAAGRQVIEFGEGMITKQLAAGGIWKAYTSVIATVDATVIGG